MLSGLNVDDGFLRMDIMSARTRRKKSCTKISPQRIENSGTRSLSIKVYLLSLRQCILSARAQGPKHVSNCGEGLSCRNGSSGEDDRGCFEYEEHAVLCGHSPFLSHPDKKVEVIIKGAVLR